MKLPIMRSAAISLLLASGLPVVLGGAMEFKGCYSSTAGMTDKGKYTFQSSGYCQQQCQKDGSKVFALWKGSNCLCGDKLPPESDKVSKDKCDVTCDGWPQDMCRFSCSFTCFSFLIVQQAVARTHTPFTLSMSLMNPPYQPLPQETLRRRRRRLPILQLRPRPILKQITDRQSL